MTRPVDIPQDTRQKGHTMTHSTDTVSDLAERGIEVLNRLAASNGKLGNVDFIAKWVHDARNALRQAKPSEAVAFTSAADLAAVENGFSGSIIAPSLADEQFNRPLYASPPVQAQPQGRRVAARLGRPFIRSWRRKAAALGRLT
jgi:hypothetical protein